MLTAVYVLAAALVVGAGGCRKTAIRPGDPRSQFEQYDRSRSEHVEPFVQDEFGRRKPNLRARLLRGG